MCMIRIRNIKIRENLKDEEILKKVILKNKIKPEEIEEWHIHKKSIDIINGINRFNNPFYILY